MRRTTALMSQWQAETLSGENLKFELCKGGYFSNIDEYGLKVVGKIDQKSLSGKNLCKGVVQGVSYYASGEWSTSNIHYAGTPETIKVTPGQTYIISFKTSNASYLDGVLGYLDDVGQGRISMSGGGVITIPANINGIRVNFYSVNEQTDTTVYEVQVEKGTTATAYEEYCGGVLSPNPEYPQVIQCVKQGAKIQVHGKNYFNINGLGANHGGAISSISGNSITITQNSTAKFSSALYYLDENDFIGKKVSVSLIAKTNGANIGFFNFTWIDADTRNPVKSILNCTVTSTEVTRFGGTSSVITKPSGNVQLALYLYSNTNADLTGAGQYSCEYKDIQFEFSEAPTEYEPYVSGGTLTVPCDLYEGDIWYPISGKVIKNMYVAELSRIGSVYLKMNTYCRFGFNFGTSMPVSVGNGLIYSNDLPNKVHAPHAGWTNDCYLIFIHPLGGSNMYVSFAYSDFGEGLSKESTNSELLQALNTYLINRANSGNPILIVYQLATPIIEQYDPQLIFAPQGTVNVLQQSIGLTADLESTMLVRRVN